jgi:hypothetical protein
MIVAALVGAVFMLAARLAPVRTPAPQPEPAPAVELAG